MNILYLLCPMALLLGGGFLWAFLSATRSGQFEDSETPPLRMLLEDNEDDRV